MYLLINKASLSFMECEIIFWQNGIHKLSIEKWQHRREGDKNHEKNVHMVYGNWEPVSQISRLRFCKQPKNISYKKSFSNQIVYKQFWEMYAKHTQITIITNYQFYNIRWMNKSRIWIKIDINLYQIVLFPVRWKGNMRFFRNYWVIIRDIYLIF